MPCEGDKIAGYDSSVECYRVNGCLGCQKCIIPCEGCENCPQEEKLRSAEVGDYVVVQKPVILEGYKGPKWVPAMDMAIGRTGWVATGNPVDGFTVKFVTTKKDILDNFLYPQEALRLALPPDNAVDRMIRTTKAGSPNEDI